MSWYLNQPIRTPWGQIGEGLIPSWTHHEGVLHPDNGAVQDGGGHRGDLQQFALPALALALH